jgi:two-component system, chemotaxis family, protein-glutamate methylesterase/glutaminase
MIVIGGSLGGCDALKEILVRLPASFPYPIAVALHRHRDSDGMMVPVVQRGCALPVCEVEDKEPIEAGHVYLCPSDYHLLIDKDCFALSTDDPVNFARPAIDVLFESAAEWKRGKAVGVVLTGSGSDGAKGARCIQQYGGTVFVQDPKTAEGPWMPTAAIASTQTPLVLSLAEIAQALINLTSLRQRSAD